MPKEKKPRKPALAKGSSAKKAALKPEPEATTFDTVSAVPEIRAAAKTRSRSTAKSPQAKRQIAPAVATQTSLEEAIRFRAYEIYLQRGGMPGNPYDDWAVAEREVLATIGQNADA